MSTLEENLSLLSGNANRAAVSSIRNALHDSDITVAVHGERTEVSFCGQPIISKYDPVREARSFIDAELGRGYTASAVFIGAGGLYHIEEYASRYPSHPLILVEQNASLLNALLAARPYPFLSRTTLLTDISVAHAAAVIDAAIPDHRIDVTAFITHPRSIQITPDYYRALASDIAALTKRKLMSMTTYYYFASRWAKNAALNAVHPRTHALASLTGMLNGSAALIVGGGPSIDAAADDIRRLARSCTVIAVATAAAPLLKHGIRPDIVVTTDGGFYSSLHLTALRGGDIPVIAAQTAYGIALRSMDICFFSQGSALERIIDPSMPVLPMSGSVIADALSITLRMQPSRIYLAAADFGYPDERTHSALGSAYAVDTALSGKLTPFTACNERRAGERIMTEDYEGKALRTSVILEAYRNAFSTALKDVSAAMFATTAHSAKLPIPLWDGTAPTSKKNPIALTHEHRTDRSALKEHMHTLSVQKDADILTTDDIAWEIAPFYMKRYCKDRSDEHAARLTREVQETARAVLAYITDRTR